jgi:hypothetical protein
MAAAIGVIQDVRASIANMRQLKTGLADAEEAAEEHRRKIALLRDKPRGFGLDKVMARMANNMGEAAVQQTGPAAAKQRKALMEYVTAQNDVSAWRRWVPVGLSLGGLVVGFVGNALSLYVPGS